MIQHNFKFISGVAQPALFALVPVKELHGPYAEEGLGLLLYKGGTVCDDKFDNIAADAICKEMNFERSIVWETDYTFERSQYEIKLDDVTCDIPDWKSCTFKETFINCFHKEDVFLSCLLRGKGHNFVFFTETHPYQLTEILKKFSVKGCCASL